MDYTIFSPLIPIAILLVTRCEINVKHLKTKDSSEIGITARYRKLDDEPDNE